MSDDESSNIRIDLGLGCEVASCPCSAGRTCSLRYVRAPPVMCRAGCGILCIPSGFGLTAEQDDGRAQVSLPVVALSGWALSLYSWKHVFGCDPAVAFATRPRFLAGQLAAWFPGQPEIGGTLLAIWLLGSQHNRPQVFSSGSRRL